MLQDTLTFTFYAVAVVGFVSLWLDYAFSQYRAFCNEYMPPVGGSNTTVVSVETQQDVNSPTMQEDTTVEETTTAVVEEITAKEDVLPMMTADDNRYLVLMQRTVKQLKEVAKELKVKNYSRMLKSDLVDAILEAERN